MASSPVVRSAKPAWAGLGIPGLLAFFLAVVALAYLPALRGGFLWDDDAHVTQPALRSLHGLWRIWFELGATQQYYPLLHSAFWFEHRLWGDSVLCYHLANVALHAAGACMLVLVLRRLEFPVPVLAATVFALHPVCVESVAWIAEQKNTLSAVAYLASALLYLRFDQDRARRNYLGSSALFLMALLTKSVTATLPAALLLVLWWRRGRIGWRRDVLPLLPWFLAGAASGLFTAWVEKNLIGAEGAPFALNGMQRFLLAGRVIAFYARCLVWPSGLTFIYPRWSVDPADAWQYLYDAGVAALLAALVIGARRRRGPLAGFLFFVGTLVPVLGFVNIYPFLFSYVADHFQYLACIGILVPIAWALDRLAGALQLGSRARMLIPFVVPMALGCLSWHQCRIYRDSDTLNRATLARNPSAWLAHYNLAVSLGNSPSQLLEAISEYRAVLRLNPDHWAAHNNLASAYMKLPGHSDDAIAEYEAALRLKPDFVEAHTNLAVALGHIPGRVAEAVAHLREALRIRPDFDGAWNNLGTLMVRQPGSLDEAIEDYSEAIRLAPDNPEYHYNLANALSAERGRLSEAVAEYEAALRLKPDYMQAHSNLGAAWVRMPGHVGDAISEYEAALRLSPASPQVHANLANALAKVPGRMPDAISEYGTAIRIDPGDPETHKDFGILLSDDPGRLQDAISEFETALRIRPDFAEAQFCLGMVLLRIPGHREEAVGHLREALRLRPDFESARKALERLKVPGP